MDSKRRVYLEPTTSGQYVVMKTVNTLDPTVGQMLKESEVERMIRDRRTEITITAPRG